MSEAPSEGAPNGREHDSTYTRDLAGLVAEARRSLASRSSEGDEIVDVPPSVREAIRLSADLLPVPPVEAPAAAARQPRITVFRVLVAAAALSAAAIFVTAYLVPDPDPAGLPFEAARAPIELAVPPEVEQVDAPAKPLDVIEVPAAPPKATASARPRPAPAKARPRPPSEAPVPPLMDAINDAVKRRSPPDKR